jgi:hypothetical protein
VQIRVNRRPLRRLQLIQSIAIPRQ